MASFLDLPLELRNEIYSLALDPAQVYHLQRRLYESELCNGLLFASQQIRLEFLPMWRAGNRFEMLTTGAHKKDLRIRHLLQQRPLAGFEFIQNLIWIVQVDIAQEIPQPLAANVLTIKGSKYLVKAEERRSTCSRRWPAMKVDRIMIWDYDGRADFTTHALVKELKTVLERKLIAAKNEEDLDE